ncbi:unnamed protein product [Adineta steineri]|uniref:Protein kinase domain-containing protein n=1 Tax=Adineta steineri TaxID=433720 RepID=A0A813S6E2_9BILA|nr:unnamed protein product [Adineta steineri]CAF3824769.1 unnamed protein product [Adineta steineri]
MSLPKSITKQSMELVKVLPSIFKAAKTIYDISKQVKANKNQCQRLSERVQCVVAILKDGSLDDSNIASMEIALRSLEETLQESVNFVQEFTDSSIISRILHNSDHQDKFEELTTRLSYNAIDLHLALNINSIFDQQQDIFDRQADLAEISSKIDELALEMVKQQEVTLKQNKNIKDEFKKRFDSFKYNLRQDVLKAQKGIEAKIIEEESKLFLHIPYHDLLFEEQIGQGGFADVYKGQWLSQHHQVAIKTIRITYLTDNIKQSVLNEIATMYKIRYNHVLGVFGACIEPNNYALVVEYMSLGSLFDVLQKNEHINSWEDRWSIALQMAKGVNYLHSMSILHCDIKSLNFLMEKAIDGYLVKISDFGLAKIRQETSRQTSEQAQQLVESRGTLQWKAPELLKFGKPSQASDIYSLGIVLWELATRCIPYDGVDEAVICQGVKAGERLEIPQDVPSSFASIISQAWSQEPNKRPTASALIQVIKTFISNTVEKSNIPKISLAQAQANDKDPIKPEAILVANELYTSHNPKLEALISQFQSCSSMNLSKQHLTDSDMDIVIQQAVVNKQCTNLWLECNKITSKGASILANALHNNTTLCELWLYGNQISDTGVHYLATVLAINTTLKKLGLAFNNITNAGVSHLVEMLKKNHTLIMLGLAMNKIGNQGVHALANTIAHENTSLEVLTLDRNEFISDSSIDALVNMIKQNQSMKELWINDCNLSEKGKKKFREKIAFKKDFKLVTTYERSS